MSDSRGGLLMASDRAGSGDTTHRAMLSFLRSVGARPHQEVYFSTPITTGPTFVEWRQHNDIDDEHPDYAALHHREVVTPNLQRVGPIVEGLRRRFPDRLVIDPTGLEQVDGWAQADYHDFWCAVVARYASMIVFGEGWQYSNGCVRELRTAMTGGIPMFTEEFVPLDPEHAIALVAEAVDELDRLGAETESLRGCLVAVREWASRPRDDG